MTRTDKIRLMQRTIKLWESAIQKHGPIEQYVRSLALEERILASFVEGSTDENGFPPEMTTMMIPVLEVYANGVLMAVLPEADYTTRTARSYGKVNFPGRIAIVPALRESESA